MRSAVCSHSLDAGFASPCPSNHHCSHFHRHMPATKQWNRPANTRTRSPEGEKKRKRGAHGEERQEIKKNMRRESGQQGKSKEEGKRGCCVKHTRTFGSRAPKLQSYSVRPNSCKDFLWFAALREKPDTIDKGSKQVRRKTKSAPKKKKKKKKKNKKAKVHV